mmetsp:Transcript_10215/g.22133  ORF Transcript_10215/g.22133 Transcript_10215/m.22133 type:complete len:704 (+) Transcript_10215:852-2963(+)
MFQLAKDLGGWEWNVDEEDHAYRRGILGSHEFVQALLVDRAIGGYEGVASPILAAPDNIRFVPPLAEHARQQCQVIIVDPNDIPPRDERGDDLAKFLIDLHVGIPPAVETALIPIALQLLHLSTFVALRSRRRAARRGSPRRRRTLPRAPRAVRPFPFLGFRRRECTRHDGIAPRRVPLPLSPAVRRQIQQIDVVKARPQHLLAKSQVHEIQKRFGVFVREEDGDAVHPLQHSLDGPSFRRVLQQRHGNVGDGSDPGGFAHGGDAVEFRLGDEALGPARVPLRCVRVAGEDYGEVVAHDEESGFFFGLHRVVVFVQRGNVGVVGVVIPMRDGGALHAFFVVILALVYFALLRLPIRREGRITRIVPLIDDFDILHISRRTHAARPVGQGAHVLPRHGRLLFVLISRNIQGGEGCRRIFGRHGLRTFLRSVVVVSQRAAHHGIAIRVVHARDANVTPSILRVAIVVVAPLVMWFFEQNRGELFLFVVVVFRLAVARTSLVLERSLIVHAPIIIVVVVLLVVAPRRSRRLGSIPPPGRCASIIDVILFNAQRPIDGSPGRDGQITIAMHQRPSAAVQKSIVTIVSIPILQGLGHHDLRIVPLPTPLVDHHHRLPRFPNRIILRSSHHLHAILKQLIVEQSRSFPLLGRNSHPCGHAVSAPADVSNAHVTAHHRGLIVDITDERVVVIVRDVVLGRWSDGGCDAQR